MLYCAGVNINYEVKDLVRAIDFYNILLGERAANLYPKLAVYTIKSMLLTFTFIEYPKTMQPICGNFNLIINSDNEVFERLIQFTRHEFASNIKVNPDKFSPDNHAFGIKDPNGIFWQLSIKDKKTNTFQFFKIPRVTSVWDVLKAL